MTRVGLVCLLLLTACSRVKPSTNSNVAANGASAKAVPGTVSSVPLAVNAGQEWKVALVGKPYQLRLKGGSLAFCDDHGGQQVDLATGRQAVRNQTCAQSDEGAGGCSDDSLGILITSPQTGPNDSVVIDGKGYWLKGRSNDCDNNGKMVVVGTDSEVDLIDGANNKVAVLSHDGADRVTIGSGWIAWRSGDGKKLSLISQSSALAKAVKP